VRDAEREIGAAKGGGGGRLTGETRKLDQKPEHKGLFSEEEESGKRQKNYKREKTPERGARRRKGPDGVLILLSTGYMPAQYREPKKKNRRSRWGVKGRRGRVLRTP